MEWCFLTLFIRCIRLFCGCLSKSMTTPSTWFAIVAGPRSTCVHACVERVASKDQHHALFNPGIVQTATQVPHLTSCVQMRHGTFQLHFVRVHLVTSMHLYSARFLRLVLTFVLARVELGLRLVCKIKVVASRTAGTIKARFHTGAVLDKCY